MAWQAVVCIIPFIAATGIATAMALRIFRLPRGPGARVGAILLLAMAQWTLANALEIGSSGLETKLFWHKVQSIGMAVMPPAWLFFVLLFVGLDKHVSLRNILLSSIVPAALVVLAFTNEAHGLVWTQVWLKADSTFSTIAKTPGPVYWTYVTYAYLIILLGAVLLAGLLLHASRLYRCQAATLLAAAALPWLASLLELAGFDLVPTLDAAPIALIVTVLVTAWGMFRLRLGDIVPVARETVLQSIGDGVIVLDAEGQVLDLNRAARRLTCHGAGEAVGRPLEQLWPEWAAHKTHLPEAGRSQEIEVRVGQDSGVYDLHVSPLADWRERQVGTVVVLHDTTGRKRVEEALRKAEEEKALILDSISELVSYLDPELRIMWTNRAAAESVDSTADDIVGQHCYEVWHHRDTPCTECPLAKALETGQHQRSQLITGDQRVLNVRGYPVRNAGGDIVGAVEIALDVTERESLERQLLKAQKMEAVGRLAGGIAHDFNNLLTAITGYTHLLMTDPDVTDSMCADLDEIAIAADRAATLTRQLLAFARRQMLQPEVLDLNAIVQDLAKLVGRLVGEDIKFETDLDPALAQVKADPGQIEQVLMNLVVNARDAMPTGGKLVIRTANAELDWTHARQHADVQPGAYVLLSVSDTGIGMDHDTLSHLYEPFFTTKEQGKGTGLGLPTVYGIVRQHDGCIWAESEPGQGTTFKVYLPQVDGADDHAQQEAASVGPLYGTETILLAEDEGAVRALTRTVLQKRGYTVLAASDGTEALAISEQHKGPIHLLVTDVIMPGMSGRELAEQLTSLHPETKVLYTSGHTDDALDRHGALDGEHAFLHKPFAPEALAHRVRQLLGPQRRAV